MSDEFNKARAKRDNNGVNILGINQTPYDRFGRPIRAGDRVLYRPPFDLIFDVVAVQPIMDPRAPAGMVSIHLTASFPFNTMPRQPLNPMVIIGRVATDGVDNSKTGGETEPGHGDGPDTPPADSGGDSGPTGAAE